MPRDISLKNYSLPTEADGLDGMLQFAELFGDAETYHFFGAVQGNRHRNMLGTVRAILAARLVLGIMRENRALSYEQARRTAADRLGYDTYTRTNFYKRADAGHALLVERGEWTPGERA